jgi:hypothetical protein
MCSYIAKLALPSHRRLAAAAMVNNGKPLPHKATARPGEMRETDSCPCPGCVAIRLGSWLVP